MAEKEGESPLSRAPTQALPGALLLCSLVNPLPHGAPISGPPSQAHPHPLLLPRPPD